MIIQVGFTVSVKRNPDLFLWNVVAPCMLLTAISLLSYLLPCESGEKISLCITVLLSYTVVLLVVADITPRAANSMPLISKDIYFITYLGDYCMSNLFVTEV